MHRQILPCWTNQIRIFSFVSFWSFKSIDSLPPQTLGYERSKSSFTANSRTLMAVIKSAGDFCVSRAPVHNSSPSYFSIAATVFASKVDGKARRAILSRAPVGVWMALKCAQNAQEYGPARCQFHSSSDLRNASQQFWILTMPSLFLGNILAHRWYII